jgi:hypothetical protein
MAAIASIAPSAGAFVANESTLGASDTIAFNTARQQLLVLRNAGGASLTLTIDGDAGTTVTPPGMPPVSVAAGYAITVPAGETRAVVLASISAYCQGNVVLTGASGLKATLFDL